MIINHKGQLNKLENNNNKQITVKPRELRKFLENTCKWMDHWGDIALRTER